LPEANLTFESLRVLTTFIQPPLNDDGNGHKSQKTHGFEQPVWLVVSTYPSKKWWSSSVGMMKIPTEWEIKHVPNHQPAVVAGTWRIP